MLLVLAACGRNDRCLDRGGSWNAAVGVCEFRSGPLDSPARAIEAGQRVLEFAFGERVLAQGPFVTELDGNVWHVHGTRSDPALGGTAHVWIELETGRVVRIHPPPKP